MYESIEFQKFNPLFEIFYRTTFIINDDSPRSSSPNLLNT